MRKTVSLPMAFFVVSILSGATGCADDADQLPNAPDETLAVALVGVTPPGGTVGVDPSSHVVLEFDHPMVDGVEALCAVHLGGLDGEEVPGAWQRSEDHHVLTFTPHDPLQLDSEHTIHVGGGITDVDGHHMDFDQHAFDMGGHWVDEDMLDQHGGMMGGHSHMGEGWQHKNGTYGMAFAFRTAP